MKSNRSNRNPRIMGVSREGQDKFVVKVEVSIMRVTAYPSGNVTPRDNVVGTFSGDNRTLLSAMEAAMVDAADFVNQRNEEDGKQLVILIEDENAASAPRLISDIEPAGV